MKISNQRELEEWRMSEKRSVSNNEKKSFYLLELLAMACSIVFLDTDVNWNDAVSTYAPILYVQRVTICFFFFDTAADATQFWLILLQMSNILYRWLFAGKKFKLQNCNYWTKTFYLKFRSTFFSANVEDVPVNSILNFSWKTKYRTKISEVRKKCVFESNRVYKIEYLWPKYWVAENKTNS